MPNALPEDRVRTARMLKRWKLWPLDAKHRAGECMCAQCFFSDGEPVDLRAAQVKRAKRVGFFWEEDQAA